jgi:hypothetical protein
MMIVLLLFLQKQNLIKNCKGSHCGVEFGLMDTD